MVSTLLIDGETCDGETCDGVQDKDITTEDSLREAGEAAGLEKELMDNLIGQIGHASVKAELQQSTQEALDLGVSGRGRGRS